MWDERGVKNDIIMREGRGREVSRWRRGGVATELFNMVI